MPEIAITEYEAHELRTEFNLDRTEDDDGFRYVEAAIKLLRENGVNGPIRGPLVVRQRSDGGASLEWS